MINRRAVAEINRQLLIPLSLAYLLTKYVCHQTYQSETEAVKHCCLYWYTTLHSINKLSILFNPIIKVHTFAVENQ